MNRPLNPDGVRSGPLEQWPRVEVGADRRDLPLAHVVPADGGDGDGRVTGDEVVDETDLVAVRDDLTDLRAAHRLGQSLEAGDIVIGASDGAEGAIERHIVVQQDPG